MLEDKLSSLKKSIALRITETVLNNKIGSLDKKIQKTRDVFEAFKGELREALLNGDWKKAFVGDVEAALRCLEQRHLELNEVLDKKMMMIPQTDAIEENINAIFLKQEDKIRSVIRSTGEQIKKEITKEAEQLDFLSRLNSEAQNITWGD